MKKIADFLKENKKEIGLNALGVLVAVAIVVGYFLFWSHYKVMWFCDEMYTYFTANSEYALGARIEPGKWYDAQFVVDDMSADITKGRFNRTFDNVRGDEHPPIYFLTIRLMSIIMKGSISPWIGLSVNLICVIIICILTYLFIYLVTKKKALALLVAFTVCTVPSALTSAMLIRMYCMLTLWGVFYSLLAYVIWKEYGRKIRPLFFVAICLVTVCGFLTQYYFAVFAVGVTIAMTIYYIVKKKWLDILWYGLSMAASVGISTVLWKSWIRQMFFGYCGQDVLKSAADFSEFISHVKYAVNIVPKLLFYDFYVLGIILIVAGVVFLIVKKHKNLPFIAILLGGSLFYCIIVAHVTPYYYLESRYFYLPATVVYIAVWLEVISVMDAVRNIKIRNVAFAVIFAGITVFNACTAWFNDMGMGYVDKSREYFEKLEILDEYADLPWLYYGFESWTMMENYYDMARGSSFILYNDLSDFDETKCPTDGRDFIMIVNQKCYPEPEKIVAKLDHCEECNHEAAYLFTKGGLFYLIRHK